MSTPHVLVVDDDPTLLLAFPKLMRLWMDWVTVDTADSAPVALERVAATDYDAIISDIRMPGMSGLELLAAIRARRPTTPILLITAYGEREFVMQALRAGAYDFIQKPLDSEYFVASLSRAIQMRHMSRQIEAQQDALARHAAELENTVAERTRDLRAALAAQDALLAERDQALVQAEAARRRLLFLAEASNRLATSLDYDTTLALVTRLAVPYLADYCSLDLVEDDGSLRYVTTTHADPAGANLVAELRRRLPPARQSRLSGARCAAERPAPALCRYRGRSGRRGPAQYRDPAPVAGARSPLVHGRAPGGAGPHARGADVCGHHGPRSVHRRGSHPGRRHRPARGPGRGQRPALPGSAERLARA